MTNRANGHVKYDFKVGHVRFLSDRIQQRACIVHALLTGLSLLAHAIEQVA
jgi:hypothetical protein